MSPIILAVWSSKTEQNTGGGCVSTKRRPSTSQVEKWLYFFLTCLSVSLKFNWNELSSMWTFFFFFFGSFSWFDVRSKVREVVHVQIVKPSEGALQFVISGCIKINWIILNQNEETHSSEMRLHWIRSDIPLLIPQWGNCRKESMINYLRHFFVCFLNELHLVDCALC